MENDRSKELFSPHFCKFSAASHLVLCCLPMSQRKVARLIGVFTNNKDLHLHLKVHLHTKQEQIQLMTSLRSVYLLTNINICIVIALFT